MTTYEIVLDEPIRGAQIITPFVDEDSLTFGSVDPGGYGFVNFQLARDVDARNYERDTEILVYDAETGEQVGGARIRNPGRSITDAGQFWEVNAIGEGPTHLQEREVPYIVIDTRLEDGTWRNGASSGRRFQWAQGNQPDDETIAGWTFTIEAGALNSGTTGRLENYTMEQFALVGGDYRVEIAGFEFTYDAGNGTDANRIQSRISSFDGTSGTDVSDHGFAVTPQVRHREITTDWPATGIGTFSDEAVVRLVLRYVRNSPSVTVGGDDDWIHAYNLRITALRLDRNRVAITDGPTYNFDYVLAHDAIVDCWARFCPRIDLVNARIDTTATYEHNDLVWPEGITPYGVAEKLMQFDPAFTWGVWNRKDNGLYEAEWRERDTDVRYEIPAEAGYTQTGAEAAPLDAAYVVAESANGAYRVLSFNVEPTPDPIRTSKTVKSDSKLDDSNFSEAALALGDDTLETSALRSAAAQVVVTGEVFDHHTGRWITSEKIRPGWNARINDANPDGAEIYRIVNNNHTARDRTSTLELNTYTLTEARAIAALLNRTQVVV